MVASKTRNRTPSGLVAEKSFHDIAAHAKKSGRDLGKS